MTWKGNVRILALHSYKWHNTATWSISMVYFISWCRIRQEQQTSSCLCLINRTYKYMCQLWSRTHVYSTATRIQSLSSKFNLRILWETTLLVTAIWKLCYTKFCVRLICLLCPSSDQFNIWPWQWLRHH